MDAFQRLPPVSRTPNNDGSCMISLMANQWSSILLSLSFVQQRHRDSREANGMADHQLHSDCFNAISPALVFKLVCSIYVMCKERCVEDAKRVKREELF